MLLCSAAALQWLVGDTEVVIPASVAQTLRFTVILAVLGGYGAALLVTPQTPPAAWRPTRGTTRLRVLAWATASPVWLLALAVAAMSTSGDARLTLVRLWLGLVGPAVLLARLLSPGLAWAPLLALVMAAAHLGPPERTAPLGLVLRWPLADAVDTGAWVAALSWCGVCLLLALPPWPRDRAAALES